jgi:hypothetical protein
MIRPDKINNEAASVPGNRVKRSVTIRSIVESTPILYFKMWRRWTIRDSVAYFLVEPIISGKLRLIHGATE